MDDLALPQHHRSGAHRARRHPLLTALAAVAAVAVVSAVLFWALLSIDVLGVGDGVGEAGGTGASASATPSTPTVEPTAPAGSPAASPAPSVATPPSDAPPSASAAPSADPTAVIDRTAALDVLNSTSTPGLAATAAGALQAQEWTIGEVTNFAGDEISTTVLYPEESLAATASAVAADLGVGSASVSGDVSRVTVVLGPDYPG